MRKTRRHFEKLSLSPIQMLIQHYGLTAREVAHLAGRSPGMMAFYERGYPTPPDVTAKLRDVLAEAHSDMLKARIDPELEPLRKALDVLTLKALT